MKVIKFFVAVFISAVFSASAHASYTYYGFIGEQVSSTLSVPQNGASLSGMDPQHPLLNGYFFMDLNATNPANVLFGVLNEFYFNVNVYLNTWPVGTAAVVSFPNNYYNVTANPASVNFDPVTRVLTAHAQANFAGAQPFCVGVVLVCGDAYSSNWSISDLNLVLTFDPTLSDFTGVGSFTKTLTGGSVYTSQFTFTTDTPLPAGAWLFGSGLVGLTGAAYRRRRFASEQI